MRTTSPIAALFGKSPFRPLQEHMRVAAECAEHLVPLFEALLAGDRDRLRDERGRIFELEREADQLKNDLRSHLPRGLFMPVDRRDLLHLLGAQDSIADGAQDIASLLTVHEIQVPECLRGELLPFTHSVLETVRVAKQAVSEIDELVREVVHGDLRIGDAIKEINSLVTLNRIFEVLVLEDASKSAIDGVKAKIAELDPSRPVERQLVATSPTDSRSKKKASKAT